jgi:TPR repeat protein
MYSRVATFVSVVSGALLGALAALVSVTPARPAAEPIPPPAQPASVSAEPPPKPASTAAAPAMPAASAPSSPEPPSKETLTEISLSCARGDPDNCRRAAAFWEATGVPGDPKRARDHLLRAVRIYTLRCEKKNPVACNELAKLQMEGRGVEKNKNNARALRQRALDLCRRRPEPACESLAQPDPLTDAAASR